MCHELMHSVPVATDKAPPQRVRLVRALDVDRLNAGILGTVVCDAGSPLMVRVAWDCGCTIAMYCDEIEPV